MAKAVCNELEKEEIGLLKGVEFINLTGRGIKGIYKENTYSIGNKSMIQHISLSDQQIEFEEREKGNTLIYFTNGNQVLALIAVSDKLKSDSVEAVNQLQRSGKEVHLLTGDNEETAKKICKELGIKNYKSEILPNDKLKYIEELQKKNKVVAMEGDGINDS